MCAQGQKVDDSRFGHQYKHSLMLDLLSPRRRGAKSDRRAMPLVLLINANVACDHCSAVNTKSKALQNENLHHELFKSL